MEHEAMQKLVRGATALMVLTMISGSVYAQATRTWVSGVGDDVNPCSRTAPCKTFAGAISKTAAGGVISVLDPGGYGGVTITKSITIDGGGIEGSILGAGANGVIINALATDHVTLRNLTIKGVGTGLTGVRILNASGKVTIQNVTINGFNYGIEHLASGSLAVHDSYLHNNRLFGIHVTSGKATIVNSRFENRHDAVRASGGSKVAVKGCTASGHINVAYYAMHAGTVLTLEDSVSANNAWGVGSQESATVSVSNTTIAGSTNSALYHASGGSLLTFGNNRLSSNAADGSFTGNLTMQ
jgi:hypothetical protein